MLSKAKLGRKGNSIIPVILNYSILVKHEYNGALPR